MSDRLQFGVQREQLNAYVHSENESQAHEFLDLLLSLPKNSDEEALTKLLLQMREGADAKLSFQETYHRLTPSQKVLLDHYFGSRFLNNFFDSSHSTLDYERALFDLAKRWETQGQDEKALPIYQYLNKKSSAELQRDSDRRLSALLGSNTLQNSDRVKYSLKNLLSHSLDYKNIAFLLAGSLSYKLIKARSLSHSVQAARLQTGTFWHSVPIALNRARALGFASEVGTFSGLSLLDQYVQRGYLTQRDLRDSALRNFITLGVLKGGFLFSKNLLPSSSSLTRYMVGSTTGVVGLMTVHDLEYWMHLRSQRLSLSENLILSVATQIQLSLAMGAGHLILGSRFAKWSQSLELQIKRNQFYLNHPMNLNYAFGLGASPFNGGKKSQWSQSINPLQLFMSPQDRKYLGEAHTADANSHALDSRNLGLLGAAPDSFDDGNLILKNPNFVIRKGDLLGPKKRYRAVQKLGEGGFGSVIEAWDLELGRPVAIKVPQMMTEDMIVLFEREMYRTAQLDYSLGTVVVFDMVEIVSGIKLPVLEFVPGFDLIKVIEQLSQGSEESKRHFPLMTRLKIFDEILEHIEEAHRRGIIHWDLKPANIRITPQQRVKIMDWGISKEFEEGKVLIRGKGGGFTKGYNDPQIHYDEIVYPRRVDIFSLGVILYELATLRHPFLPYIRQQGSNGELEFVVAGELNAMSTFFNARNTPSFRDLCGSDHSDPFYELESIFKKATQKDPQESYATVAEMREEVKKVIESLRGISLHEVRAGHLAKAHSAIDRIEILGRDYNNIQQLLRSFSEQGDGELKNPKDHWESVDAFIARMRLIQSDTRTLYQTAFTELVTALGLSRTPSERSEISQALAELTWYQLSSDYDHLSIPEREALKDSIHTYDQVGHLVNALERSVDFKVNLTNIEKRLEVQLSLKRFKEDEMHNFLSESNQTSRSESGIFEASYGHYLLNVLVPGYAPMNVPIRITLDMVLEAQQKNRPIEIDIELIPSQLLKGNMIPIHRGYFYSGYDFLHGEHPSMVYSFPLRVRNSGHFAISQNPITVAEYKLFIEDLLSRNNVEEALNLLPGRYKGKLSVEQERPPQIGFLSWFPIFRFFKSLFKKAQSENLDTKNSNIISEKEMSDGSKFHWRIVRQEEKWVLIDPTSHVDMNGDPIAADFSVHSITREAAERYVAWRSEKDGVKYRLPTADELEKVARNSFHWTYPWGNNFNPNYLLSRSVFKNAQDAYVRSANYIPEGIKSQNRDNSLYGVQACIGNAREHTSTDGPEPKTVVIFGGSVATPNGPFFLPAARVYAHRPDWAMDAIGAFRLVQDLE